jgi:benzoylformate decarboxylase
LSTTAPQLSIKDALAQVFAQREVEFIFGNPGSTELPFLAGLPDDITYVMALQEASVVAMANGYALRTGKTPIVNVHTGPGLGNAIGGMFNMMEAHLPAIIVVGQQDTRHLRDDPVLSADLVRMAEPITKWAHQPVNAADVPLAFERAFRVAESGTPGPVLLALPMDFFEGSADPAPSERVVRAGGIGPVAPELAAELRESSSVAMITGSRVELSGAWDAVVELAETLDADVYNAPFQSLPGFPTNHPLFRHSLPVTRSAIGAVMAPYEHVLALGVPAFRVYPFSEGPVVSEGTRLTVISDVATDLTVNGVSGARLIEGSIGEAARELVDSLGGPPPRSVIEVRAPQSEQEILADVTTSDSPITIAEACRMIVGMAPAGTVLADESVSTAAVLAKRWKTSAPHTHMRTASGGLGFAIPAAVGAALGGGAPMVLGVIGDGSFSYSPQALWTAAQHQLPVKIVVLRNGGYKILADYHESVSAHLGDLPSMRVPGVDSTQIAEGFGVPARSADHPAGLAAALAWLYDLDGPGLVEVAVEWSSKSMFR